LKTIEDTYASRLALVGVMIAGIGLYFNSNASITLGCVMLGLYGLRRWLQWRDEL